MIWNSFAKSGHNYNHIHTILYLRIKQLRFTIVHHEARKSNHRASHFSKHCTGLLRRLLLHIKSIYVCTYDEGNRATIPSV